MTYNRGRCLGTRTRRWVLRRVPVAVMPGGCVLVRLMGMLGLQKADAPGQRDAEEEGERQPEAIVGMEGDFGQKVGERNA